jgi:hypothetical protein
VPRLPIAPRADDGDHGRIRTATGQALDLLPLPGWATWPLVPPGGLEPPPHGLRTRRAAFTLRRDVGLMERMAGLEPAPQGLEGPQATVTPHSPWFGTWYQSLIPRPNTDRWRSPAQELLSVVKDPALASSFGDSARIRTRTHEVWRLGCSPLHHAVVALSRLDRFRDRTSLRPDEGFLPRQAKTKKAF